MNGSWSFGVDVTKRISVVAGKKKKAKVEYLGKPPGTLNRDIRFLRPV